MRKPVWQVVIADLRASTSIPAAARARVDRGLVRAAERARRRFAKGVRLGPELLRGDELQCLLRGDTPALAFLTYLRARFVIEAGEYADLRAGVGSGAVTRLSPKGPFASDGEAFHRARAALQQAHDAGGTRRTAWVTGDPFADVVLDSTLGLADACMSRWTAPQWEAVAGRLEDKALQVIARERGVAFQSVSKRLRAASWSEYQRVIEVLEATARAATLERPAGSRIASPARG